MTTGALLLSLSSLSSGTALQHLQNIMSSGPITWLPAQLIDADMSQMTLSADIEIKSISADVTLSTLGADISHIIYDARITQNILQGALNG